MYPIQGIHSIQRIYPIYTIGIFEKNVFAEFIIPNNQIAAYEVITIGAATNSAQGFHTIDANRTYIIASDASLTEDPNGKDINIWRQIGDTFYKANGQPI